MAQKWVVAGDFWANSTALVGVWYSVKHPTGPEAQVCRIDCCG